MNVEVGSNEQTQTQPSPDLGCFILQKFLLTFLDSVWQYGQPSNSTAHGGRPSCTPNLAPCCFFVKRVSQQRQCLDSRHSYSGRASLLQFYRAEHSTIFLLLSASSSCCLANKKQPICAYTEVFNCIIMPVVMCDFFSLYL